MHAISEEPIQSPIGETPAFIASLIESAARHFDTDRSAARDCLLRAHALLRTHNHQQSKQIGRERGRLATWQARRALSYIDGHLDSPIRVAELAELVGLSPSHFFRAFKISVGTPPCEYIVRRRILLACERMRTTTEPLAQIALTFGFGEQSSFCRVFSRIVGSTPGRWRRANALLPSGISNPKE